MNEDQSPEEAQVAIDDFNKTTLSGIAFRSVLYAMIVYAIAYFFPSLVWMWYVLAAYILFDATLFIYGKYIIYKYNKDNSSGE